MDVSSHGSWRYFLKLIRWKNLMMLAVLQYFLQYIILVPSLKAEHLEPVLDPFHFALLVLSTMIIAAGGYIINDIYDYNIDRINKPDKQVLGRAISMRQAVRSYIFILIVGLVLALYLAWYVQNLWLATLYVMAAISLWLYSKVLKRTALGGNIFVGLFCAFVAVIVAFAERKAIYDILQSDFYHFKDLAFTFVIFGSFAFLTTLYREIIKDIEDIEGDRKNHCHTLPIAYGVAFARNFASFINVIVFLLLLYLVVIFFLAGLYWRLLYLLIFVLIPVVLNEYLLRKAQIKEDYHKLSSWNKYVMFSGIILIAIMKV